MSIKKLGLALAVSALASGANAALFDTTQDAGNTGGSSLLFAAYDAASTTALYVDLNALLPNMRVHTLDRDGMPGQSINLNAVASANGFSLANVQWTVVGGDSAFGGGACATGNLAPCGFTYMATVADGAAVPASFTSNTITSTTNGVNSAWYQILRGAIDTGNGHSTTVGDGNNGQFIDGLNQAQNLWNVTGSTGDTLAFAIATVGATTGRTGPASLPNGYTSTLPGTWTLSNGGELSYSAVPVPAALWMFASGLVGLAGVARRRKQA